MQDSSEASVEAELAESPHLSRTAALRQRLNDEESFLGKAWRLIQFALARATNERVTQVASSLTYTSVLSMVPLLTVGLALFTAFPLFQDFQAALEEFLMSNLMPANISDNIVQYLNVFAAKAGGLTAVGGGFLLVTAVLLMLTIDKALNEIWHVRRPRRLSQKILIYWAMLTLGPVLLGASLWATTMAVRTSMGLAGSMSWVLEFLLSFLPMVLSGVGFTFLFMVVPNRHVEIKDAAVGGFASAIILEIMKAGFAFYLTQVPTYTLIYGAFAAIPIFLVWVYVSWLVILLGAILAASLPLIRMGRWVPNKRAGDAFIDALAILRALYEVQGAPSPGLSLKALHQSLNLDYDELMDVFDALAELGYVARIGEEGSATERWALVCDPQTAPLGPIMDKLLLDRSYLASLADEHLRQAVEAACEDRSRSLAEVLAEPELDPALAPDTVSYVPR
ncbi:MAG: YihY family inner membrane protein [Pigmentiphaga sp.]